MLKLEPLSLSTLLVAVPLTHLIVTGAYLLCYCIGFGANIGAFLAVEDVFSTSLTQVAPIYVTAFIFPGLISLWRHSWKYPYEADRIAAIEDPARKRRARLNLSASRWMLGLVAVFGLISVSVQMVDAHLRATPMPVVSFASLTFVFGPLLLSRWANSGQLPWRLYEVAVLVIFFTASALGAGVSRGQSDRLSTFNVLQGSRPTCGEYLVLRKISGQLLAVDPDDRRVLLNEDCEPVIEFPKAQARGYLQWSLLPIALYE